MKDFNLQFSFRLFWIAFLLLLIRNFTAGVSIKLLGVFDIVNEKALNHVQVNLQSGWITWILIVVINSVYEETLIIGYLFKRLEKYHPVLVIGFSAMIRISYHTYQGWVGVFVILCTGLIFGFYYFRYKKLWPLIIGHGIDNLMVFLVQYFHWQGFHNT